MNAWTWGKLLWACSWSTRMTRSDTCYSPWNSLQMVPKLLRDTLLPHFTTKEKPSTISPSKSRHLYQYKGKRSSKPCHAQHWNVEKIYPWQSLTKPNYGYFEWDREKRENKDGKQQEEYNNQLGLILQKYGLMCASPATVYCWMVHLGFRYQPTQKECFVDGHKQTATIRYRWDFCPRYLSYERRKHRWV